MIETIKYVGIYIVALIGVWLVGTAFADKVSKYELINPDNGVKCVVVSRMFNTSVACWKD